MLSSPRSLGFVLAAIVGAMLVPGCWAETNSSRPADRAIISSPPSGSDRVTGPSRPMKVVGRSYTPPASPPPANQPIRSNPDPVSSPPPGTRTP
jgi:hypothetical protein